MVIQKSVGAVCAKSDSPKAYVSINARVLSDCGCFYGKELV